MPALGVSLEQSPEATRQLEVSLVLDMGPMEATVWLLEVSIGHGLRPQHRIPDTTEDKHKTLNDVKHFKFKLEK